MFNRSAVYPFDVEAALVKPMSMLAIDGKLYLLFQLKAVGTSKHIS